jgi:hypothetical protein
LPLAIRQPTSGVVAMTVCRPVVVTFVFPRQADYTSAAGPFMPARRITASASIRGRDRRPHHGDGARQKRHHRQTDGQRVSGFPDVPGEHIERLPAGIVSPIVEDPRRIGALMVKPSWLGWSAM